MGDFHLFKSLITVLLVIVSFLVVSNVVYAPSNPETIDENKLYVTVTELVGSPETGMETAISDAKVSLAHSSTVSLAHGSTGGEQSMPAEWQDIPVNVKGQAVFSNIQSGVYTITAKASGYISSQKEFTKESGKTGYVSVALIKAPADATGSVRIAVLVQVPQSPVALTTAKIELYKSGKLITSSDTKNTRGKEGVVFPDLYIGENYEALVTAPDYESQRKSFVVETNKETWLPIMLEPVRVKPESCPDNCACDENNVIIGCYAKGKSDEGKLISPETVSKILINDNKIVDSVNKVELKVSSDKKPVYETTGRKTARILFLFPVEIGVHTTLSAENGKIKNVEKPWWNFLAW